MSPPLPLGMLNCSFEDNLQLQKSFMPFFRNGGLFIETTRPYKMGDKVVILLSLPDKSRHAASGEVSWINPGFGHRPAGVGISFSDADSANQEVRVQIENLLVGLTPLDQPSMTL